MINLLGKKILFLAPKGSCLHYSKGILHELESRGAEVTFYDERPYQNSVVKILLKKFKKKWPAFYSYYIKYIIQKNKRKDYDFVFVIRGEGFMPASLKLLRIAYPHAKFILYMWDVLAAVDVREVIPYFDKVYSFDPEDVALMERKLIFRPTFFLNDYRKVKNREKKYDVFFVGSIYANRYTMLNSVKAILYSQRLIPYFYYYLPSRFLFLRNYILSNRAFKAKYSDFKYSPLSFQESIDVFSVSRSILDIRYSSQKSLSMRAFEALGAGIKYITNNPEIKKYDFYDSANVYLLGNEDRSISEFLALPLTNIDSKIISQYSVSSWIETVFS